MPAVAPPSFPACATFRSSRSLIGSIPSTASSPSTRSRSGASRGRSTGRANNRGDREPIAPVVATPGEWAPSRKGAPTSSSANPSSRPAAVRSVRTACPPAARDVVVGLDHRGRPAHRARVDDIGIERALHEEAHIAVGSAAACSKTRDEDFADAPGLLFRIVDVAQHSPWRCDRRPRWRRARRGAAPPRRAGSPPRRRRGRRSTRRWIRCAT